MLEYKYSLLGLFTIRKRNYAVLRSEPSMNSLQSMDLPEEQPFEDELLLELYRQMLRVVRQKLRNKGDAGDVVQEAWVRILEKRESLREADKLIPWAKTIASNLASNANRARRMDSVEDIDDIPMKGQAEFTPPELFAVLSDLLGRLDPKTRTLLLYKFYYGFTDDEIAASFGLPVGTVKARIHRSKARLKAQIKEDRAHT
jgi:RNA polymerase sigma-70 factor (ECF subfamily)